MEVDDVVSGMLALVSFVMFFVEIGSSNPYPGWIWLLLGIYVIGSMLRVRRLKRINETFEEIIALGIEDIEDD